MKPFKASNSQDRATIDGRTVKQLIDAFEFFSELQKSICSARMARDKET